MIRMAVALGANLGDREATLERAVEEIARSVGKVLVKSTLIETEALVPPERPEPQPAYLNGVVLVETDLTPEEVLHELLRIESILGRSRQPGSRWAPRTIDLDLLCAEDRVIKSEALEIPHPEMHRRVFVLNPLVEVWPNWRHPILGLTAAELYERTRSP